MSFPDKTTADRWNFRSESRKEYWWTRQPGERGLTLEALNAGALMRIADATEKIASNYDLMREDRDRYKRWYEEARARERHLERRVRALRGVITRLRRLVVREHQPKGVR